MPRTTPWRRMRSGPAPTKPGRGSAAPAGPRATGPLTAVGALIDGTAWYAAGVAPSVSANDFSWRAARQVDADNDGVPDGLPGDPTLVTIEQTHTRTLDYLVPAMARVGVDRGP